MSRYILAFFLFSGISNIAIRRLGSVEIKSHQLLVDGFRSELRRRLKSIIGDKIKPQRASISPNIVASLLLQSSELAKLQKTFLFTCENIGINGIEMWRTNIEDVLCSFLKDQKLQLEQLQQVAPTAISSAPSLKSDIIAQTIRALLAMTDPRSDKKDESQRSIYCDLQDNCLRPPPTRVAQSGWEEVGVFTCIL